MFMWEVYISMAMSMAERLKRRQKICTTKNMLMKKSKIIQIDGKIYHFLRSEESILSIDYTT